MAEHTEMHSYPELMELATRHHASVLEQACDCFVDSLDAEGSEAQAHHLDMFSEAQREARRAVLPVESSASL
ncbi:hypothetical protein ABBQ38_004783 [Trebouxia sp. C0009 RCD-2024]